MSLLFQFFLNLRKGIAMIRILKQLRTAFSLLNFPSAPICCSGHFICTFLCICVFLFSNVFCVRMVFPCMHTHHGVRACACSTERGGTWNVSSLFLSSSPVQWSVLEGEAVGSSLWKIELYAAMEDRQTGREGGDARSKGRVGVDERWFERWEMLRVDNTFIVQIDLIIWD